MVDGKIVPFVFEVVVVIFDIEDFVVVHVIVVIVVVEVVVEVVIIVEVVVEYALTGMLLAAAACEVATASAAEGVLLTQVVTP